MSRARSPWVYPTTYYITRAIVEATSGLRLEGFDHVRPSGKLIIAFNHRSLLDGPLASMAVARKRFPHSLAKAELFRNPLLGWFLRNVGVLSLDRSGGDSSGMRAALSTLEAGGCIQIFPEGTRSKTGEPGRARPGVGLLAHHSGAPVVPARLRNTEKYPSLNMMTMTFGPEIQYHGEGGKESYQEFAEQVMEAVFKL